MNEIAGEKSVIKHLFQIPVIVAALGYFVDIYDLLLFGIVRLPSLKDLGLSEHEISATGTAILNWQMTGLLLGGILWGVLGDKKAGFPCFRFRNTVVRLIGTSNRCVLCAIRVVFVVNPSLHNQKVHEEHDEKTPRTRSAA